MWFKCDERNNARGKGKEKLMREERPRKETWGKVFSPMNWMTYYNTIVCLNYIANGEVPPDTYAP